VIIDKEGSKKPEARSQKEIPTSLQVFLLASGFSLPSLSFDFSSRCMLSKFNKSEEKL